MRSNKQKIKKLVKDMLIESHKKALKNVGRVLDSGCIDIDGWDEKDKPMIIPKCILTAILENESRQYTARGTAYERQVQKEVRNIHFYL